MSGATLKVEGDENRRRGANTIRKRRRALAEPLQQHVSAERDAAEDDRSGGKILEYTADREGEIACLARGGKAGGAIFFGPPPPKKHHVPAPNALARPIPHGPRAIRAPRTL